MRLRPGPHHGSLQYSPNPPAEFGGEKGVGGEGMSRERKGGKGVPGKEREGRG